MDLDSSELYWTRKQKGLVTEEKTENYIRSLETQVQADKKKIKELENADLTTVYMSGFYDGEKKWRDKINEQIEEYNKMINATYGDITYQGDIRRDNCIETRYALQELLEEDK